MQDVKSYTIWDIFVTLCTRWKYPVTFCHNSIAWHQRAKVKNVDVKVQMWARKWKGVHVTNPAKTVVPSRHSEVRGRLLQSGHWIILSEPPESGFTQGQEDKRYPPWLSGARLVQQCMLYYCCIIMSCFTRSHLRLGRFNCFTSLNKH